ncbi:hypothetical protein AKJ16_DCAP03000 [Drosera capensis]
MMPGTVALGRTMCRRSWRKLIRVCDCVMEVISLGDFGGKRGGDDASAPNLAMMHGVDNEKVTWFLEWVFKRFALICCSVRAFILLL